jgi:hypothetical protein
MVFKVMGMGLVLIGLVQFILGLFPGLPQDPAQAQFGQLALAAGVVLYAIGSVSEALDARGRGRRG